MLHFEQIFPETPLETKQDCSIVFKYPNFYIFGGHSTHYHSSFIEFNVENKTWKRLKEYPTARNGHACVLYGDLMIIAHGYNGHYCLNDMFVYNISTKQWNDIVQVGKFSGRYIPSMCVLEKGNEDFLYFFAGYCTDSVSAKNDMYKSLVDCSIIKWEMVEQRGDIPSARYGHATAIYRNQLYIFGGKEVGRAAQVNDLYVFDPISEIWTKIIYSGQNPEPMQGHGCVVKDERMYIFGGYGAEHYNKLYEYNFRNSNWKLIVCSGSVPSLRARHATALYGNYMYIYGGSFNAPEEFFNDLYRIQLPSPNLEKMINILRGGFFFDILFKWSKKKPRDCTTDEKVYKKLKL